MVSHSSRPAGEPGRSAALESGGISSRSFNLNDRLSKIGSVAANWPAAFRDIALVVAGQFHTLVLTGIRLSRTSGCPDRSAFPLAAAFAAGRLAAPDRTADSKEIAIPVHAGHLIPVQFAIDVFLRGIGRIQDVDAGGLLLTAPPRWRRRTRPML